jgi:transposase
LSRSDEVLKSEIEADKSHFGGKRKGKRGRVAGGRTIVFGILERGGKVSVKIVNQGKRVHLKARLRQNLTQRFFY